MGVVGLWIVALCTASAHSAEPTLSYTRDILPVLTRAGCNMGACHGAQTGKGDLNLSLRGELAQEDHAILIKSFIRSDRPERSPLLRKPTLEADHEGGLRFDKDSESYALLDQWIRQGAPFTLPDETTLERLEVTPTSQVVFAPESEVAIQATAVYSDGSTRDVNRWALFEPSELNVEVSENGVVTRLRPGETTISVRYLGLQVPVRLAFVPERRDFVWENPPAYNFIDTALQAKWRTLRLNPSGLCDDATFLRRVTLDLTGAIPPPEIAQEFVRDPNPNKRAQLVDRLLVSPDFATFWTLKWSDLLRLEEKVLDRTGVAAFHDWIREAIDQGMPIDHFCRSILTGLGSTYDVPPANYYRALRKPDLRAEAVAQVFMGTRLGCAKCHNHPFEKWTQDQYYQFAAVFDGIDYEIIENKRFDNNDRNNFVGEQIVQLVDERTLKHPRSGARPEPRFLGVETPVQSPESRLEELASWMTDPEHPLFARVWINRIWSQLMGRGIVEPIDDFRSTNPPSNPALLDALTEDFVSSGFDLRHAIRTICASRAYQLSAEPNPTNAEDTINFARAIPRRLDAEQLLDSIYLSLDTLPEFEGYEAPMRAISVPGIRAIYRPKRPTAGDTFLHLFGKPPRLTNSDTERVNDTSLAQVFELTSGATLNQRLSQPGGYLHRLVEETPDDHALIHRLYWRTLTREPSASEDGPLVAYLQNAEDRRRAVEDITWALFNSKEFLLRP